MKKILFLLSIAILIGGCASKRYTKQAGKFEEAGLYEDAAEYYYQAIKKKDSNVEAKLGLIKNGQLTLDRKLADFNSAYKQADYKKAVYDYLEAEKFNNKIKTVNIELDFPKVNKEYYQEAKNDYLNIKYSDGLDKLNREDFSAALVVFEEIKGIDFDYKDVKELYKTAKYEPIYRNANQYLETELYRKAYYTFAVIIKGAGNYKQSEALKSEAQEKGTISILITGFSHTNSRYREAAGTVTSGLNSELNELSNPFIRIIDPSILSANIYQNGKINMQAANLAGIKAILIGSVTKASAVSGKLVKKNKKGYIKEVTKTKDKEGNEIKKVKYYKTTYTEYEQVNRANFGLNFKLISTTDNTVMISDVINTSNSDKIHYATFSGDKNKLIPGNWKYKDRDSKEDIKKDNKSDRNKLKRLLKADRKIKSSKSLLSKLMNESVSKMTQEVNKYNPEK